MDLNLIDQPRRKRSPYQVIRHSDGTVTVIACHRGGCSRYFGVDEKETTKRAKSYEAANHNRNQQ